MSAGPFFRYFLNLPAGDYAVSLYFADTNSTALGQRLTDVFFDGVRVLTALDVYNTSGSNALVLTKAATVVSGLLTVSFVGLNNTAAAVAAIKVAPFNVNATLPALAIDIGSSVATLSETGVVYQPDNSSYYSLGAGGNVTTAAPGVNFTLGGLPANGSFYAPALYRTARVGALNLTIPLPNGDYLVDLEFADVTATTAVQRVFSVVVNGQVALPSLALGANATSNGTAAAVVKDSFTANGTSAGTVVKVQVRRYSHLTI